MYEVRLLNSTDTHRAKTLKQASRLAAQGLFIVRKCLRGGNKGPWAKYCHLGAMAHREAVQGQ